MVYAGEERKMQVRVRNWRVEEENWQIGDGELGIMRIPNW
ncbi:hypothetical protein QFZ28_000620 [Neobacillus niacini]|jgi:hypothetical protein|nr:hypothetical protein [Neobacillus niacini]